MIYTVGVYTVKAPSKHKHKKYDVYLDGKYKLSYGDSRYQQYQDKLGYYKNLDHLDPERRKRYRKRHHKDNIDDPNYAGYWSYWYLW
jgi:hypothetical protein